MRARARPDHPNLLMVILDTARRDRFGCYGSPRGLTPVIDDVARAAIVYDNIVATGPGTLPSHGSLFTGLYPRAHGAQNPVPIMRSDVPTLAESLAKHSYTTMALCNNALLRGPSGVLRGFSTVRGGRDIGGHKLLRRGRRILGIGDAGTEATVRAFTRMLPGLTQPFFVFINIMETHWPYAYPRWAEKRVVNRRLSWVDSVTHRVKRMRYGHWHFRATYPASSPEFELLNLIYDGALAYADSQFGRFLEALEAHKLLQDTIIVVLADHGETLGDHGLGHDASLHSVLTSVPFIVRIPGRPAAREPGLFQFTDFFASVCRLLDLPSPEHLADDSRSLHMFSPNGPARREYAFAEWTRWPPEHGEILRRRCPQFNFDIFPATIVSAQNLRFKLIVHRNPDAMFLYDLSLDPGETQNVLDDFPSVVREFQSALEKWEQSIQTHIEPYSPDEMTAIENRLKALGYL